MGYEMNLSTPPLLTIVVPCYNEEAAFPFCLHILDGSGDGFTTQQ